MIAVALVPIGAAVHPGGRPHAPTIRGLATDAMADMDPEAHRNSIERIFPRLGETGTTAEIVELLAGTRP